MKIQRTGNWGKMICKTCGEEIPLNGCSFYEAYDERTGVQDFEHGDCFNKRIGMALPHGG